METEQTAVATDSVGCPWLHCLAALASSSPDMESCKCLSLQEDNGSQICENTSTLYFSGHGV